MPVCVCLFAIWFCPQPVFLVGKCESKIFRLAAFAFSIHFGRKKKRQLFLVLFSNLCTSHDSSNDQLILQMRQANNSRGTFNIATLDDDQIEVLYGIIIRICPQKAAEAFGMGPLLFTIRTEQTSTPPPPVRRKRGFFILFSVHTLCVRSFQINITTDHIIVVMWSRNLERCPVLLSEVTSSLRRRNKNWFSIQKKIKYNSSAWFCVFFFFYFLVHENLKQSARITVGKQQQSAIPSVTDQQTPKNPFVIATSVRLKPWVGVVDVCLVINLSGLLYFSSLCEVPVEEKRSQICFSCEIVGVVKN